MSIKKITSKLNPSSAVADRLEPPINDYFWRESDGLLLAQKKLNSL